MERRTNDINQKSKDITRVGQISALQTKKTLGKNSLWLMGDVSVQNCAFPWAFKEVDGTTLEEKWVKGFFDQEFLSSLTEHLLAFKKKM